MRREIRQLYKSLIRLARKFDSSPAAMSLIYRMNINWDHKSLAGLYYTDILDKFVPKALFYFGSSRTKIIDVIRNEFRASERRVPRGLATGDLDVVAEESTISSDDRIDCAYHSIKKLSTIWNWFESRGVDTQNIDSSVQNMKCIQQFLQSTRLTASVAETLSPGILLAAHPLVAKHYKRALVLLLAHGEKGSHGLIINKRTDSPLNQAFANVPADFNKVFRDKTVYFGGSMPRMNCLHRIAECGGEILPYCTKTQIFHGMKLETLSDVVAKDKSFVDEFQFFSGAFIWGPGELERQVEQGLLLPIKTSPDALLDLTRAIDDEIIDTSMSSSTESPVVPEEEFVELKVGSMFSRIPPQSTGMPATATPSADALAGYIWKKVLESIDDRYASIASLSLNLDITDIDPIDWRDWKDTRRKEFEGRDDGPM